MSPKAAVPLGLRGRVQLLYRSRRQRLLEEPTAALARHFGSDLVELDRTEFRHVRVSPRDDLVVEASFAGVFRMFGVLIDTQWLARRGSTSTPEMASVNYRFDLEKFRGSEGLAQRLGETRTRALAKEAELKSIKVTEFREGRLVDLTPLPGTITAMYLPPLPPYTVTIKPEEADAQLALLLHLADL